MVDEERLFLMTRMASFEENEGKKTIPICEFFRSDYVGFHMLLSAVYITVAYVRKYESERADKTGLNCMVFTVCLVLDMFIILMINVLGQRIAILEHELMHMQRLQNPLLIIMAITSFNLFRNIKIHSVVINHISALTLYIYIIHENILFRTYTRPFIWNILITRYGYDHVLICALCYAVILFMAALAVSEIYFLTLHKAVMKAVEAIAKRFFS